MNIYSASEEFVNRFVHPKAGRTLIVGSFVTEDKKDRRGLYQDVVGVDMRPGPGVDRVLNMEEDLPANFGHFAHVECCSVLEHSRRPWLMAANIERAMKKGSTLFVSVPFVWRYHDYPGDLWRMTHEGVRALFPGIQWHRVMYASNRLKDDQYLRAQEFEEHPHLPRCEVMGFGVRA